MNLATIGLSFALIFVAELPDKTALATLVLATKYRIWPVLVGAAAAFTMHVVLAVAVGDLLSLLPHRILQSAVAVVFVVGAFLLLRGAHGAEAEPENDAEAPSGLRMAITAFWVIAVAEFGDLTQLATASLAARYADPLSVGVGATLALWAVAAVAAVGGQALMRWMPVRIIVKIAAALMLLLAALSIIAAIRG